MAESTNLEARVVVVGAGPVGMLFALRLAQLGAPSLLVEQNEDTIRMPKMDVTNIRSMEILRFMGLEYRRLGPKEELPDWVTPFTTGMGKTGHHLFTWVCFKDESAIESKMINVNSAFRRKQDLEKTNHDHERWNSAC